MEGKIKDITKEIKIEDVINMAKKNNKNINKEKIIKAYKYAAEKHKNQFRKSGEPYIIHPLHVAYILAELGLDTQTICAALLHDVVEDTDSTNEDIIELFGEGVAETVAGVTKLTDIFKTIEEKQTANYKKLFAAMEKDIRVIILKLADRLHNISTLQYLKKDRQIAIATETIELYAPIAHKLGMYEIKMKLQDGAFEFVEPEKYKEISEELEKRVKEREKDLEKTKEKIKKELKKSRITAKANVEYKHLYNIYMKMKEKNINIDQVKDLFAIKIITKNKSECYKALGIINTLYSLSPNSFKDYIATPRNNYYQSIQEIILGENGVIVEVQICSEQMNNISKYGIIEYLQNLEKKENKNEKEIDKKINFERNLSGIKDSLELENIIENPKEFLHTLKEELLDKEIYIFTPKGDIKVLPKESSVLDFAYSVSDDIGNYATACKINNKEKTLFTKLKNGDIVEIKTSGKLLNPEKEWLEDIKTAKAKSKLVKLMEIMEKNEFQENTIKIHCKDRKGMVLDIIRALEDKAINILELSTEMRSQEAVITISMRIEKDCNSKKITENIKKIEDINRIELLESE